MWKMGRRQEGMGMRTQYSLWRLLVASMVCSLVEASSEFHVDTDSGRIVDSSGRERIFHGLNVVMKGSPWHPSIDSFDPQLSFADEDIANLKDWGLNVVRLAVMWPGVEPQRGHFNQTYIAIMQAIVRKLHSAGIYTLLEFHQDLFSSRFCGEGVPAWVFEDTHFFSQSQAGDLAKWWGAFVQASVTKIYDEITEIPMKLASYLNNLPLLSASPVKESESGVHGDAIIKSSLWSKDFVESFPELLGGRLSSNIPVEAGPNNEQPSDEQCSHAWFWYYFTYPVSRAFQDLYENKWGWGDLLARYWQTVATKFRDQPGMLGYELMNEPWVGDFFHNPLLMIPGVADQQNLVPFYEKLQSAIRSVDPGCLLFIETVTFEDVRCGFSTVPGGIDFKNRTVLSYHYYRPPNLSPTQAFKERLRESERLGCGAMLTEFFVAKVRDSVDEVLEEADKHLQSWIGWEYKAFTNKTGSNIEQSLFNSDGKVNLLLAEKLARTYPLAVMGKIDSFFFDPSSSAFSLIYNATNQGGGDLTETSQSTQVFVHRSFYYSTGIKIEVNRDCVHVQETESIIYLSHSEACVGLIIDLRISKTATSSS